MKKFLIDNFGYVISIIGLTVAITTAVIKIRSSYIQDKLNKERLKKLEREDQSRLIKPSSKDISKYSDQRKFDLDELKRSLFTTIGIIATVIALLYTIFGSPNAGFLGYRKDLQDATKKLVEQNQRIDSLENRIEYLQGKDYIFDQVNKYQFVFDVHFDFNKVVPIITDCETETIDSLVNVFKQNSQIKILVYGHADEPGTDDANLIISRLRAENVSNELIKRGIPKDVLEISYFGDRRPVIPTRNSNHFNRRVEVYIERS